MKIDYVARHFRLDDETREFADKKLDKAVKFLEEPIEVRVVLEETKHLKNVDIHASHRFGSLQATEQTESFKDALHLAIDKIEKQARRSRKKAKGKKRRNHKLTAENWPIEVLASDSLKSTEGPRIVDSIQLPIKPMDLEEAALELEHSDNQFVVFRDAESGQVNVLYRRRDQNYGLITPEL